MSTILKALANLIQLSEKIIVIHYNYTISFDKNSTACDSEPNGTFIQFSNGKLQYSLFDIEIKTIHYDDQNRILYVKVRG